MILFRDRSDHDKMIEDSDGFFDISTSLGLSRFRTYMAEAATRCSGGGDGPEQAYEAIRHMTEKYFRKTGDSYHTPGAATIGIVISDVRPHYKNDTDYAQQKCTELDAAAVKALLEGTDDGGQFPRVMLNTIFARFRDRTDPLWDSQMSGLSAGSRGISTTMDLFGDAAGEVPRKLAGELETIIEERRERATKERAGFASLYTRTEDGTPVLDFDTRAGRDRYEEIIPPHVLKEMQKRMGNTVFSFLFTQATVAGDHGPRWLPRVLLTKNEVLRLSFTCRELGGVLKESLAAAADLDSGTEAYHKLIIQCLKTVLGEKRKRPPAAGPKPLATTVETVAGGDTPDRAAADGARSVDPITDLPDDPSIDEIEAALSKLPIRLACLSSVKRTISRADTYNLAETLEEAPPGWKRSSSSAPRSWPTRSRASCTSRSNPKTCPDLSPSAAAAATCPRTRQRRGLEKFIPSWIRTSSITAPGASEQGLPAHFLNRMKGNQHEQATIVW